VPTEANISGLERRRGGDATAIGSARLVADDRKMGRRISNGPASPVDGSPTKYEDRVRLY